MICTCPTPKVPFWEKWLHICGLDEGREPRCERCGGALDEEAFARMPDAEVWSVGPKGMERLR